ncbi:MAG: phenylacetic acid degradation operon negative regulatory protein PaaX [Hyphomicrobiaceae bacterium]
MSLHVRPPPARPASLDDVLRAILERSAPPRAWSLVVTIFGDAIGPRGGSLWLGTLNEIADAFGIGEGVVRTAMSRLAADGWVERQRVGRNSYYRLTPQAMEETDAASRVIYAPAPGGWSHQWTLAVIAGEDKRARSERRTLLRHAGFGRLGPDLFVAPSPVRDAQALGGRAGFVFEDCASLGPEGDRRLAAGAWPLDELAASYRRFVETFKPVASQLDRRRAPPERASVALRLLLIHELRRIVLRDPGLPVEIVGADWPGRAARALAKDVWHGLLAPSETWLDRNGRGIDGPLPAPSAALGRRFGGT